MLRGTKRCDSFFAQGRAGESTYRVYTALSREYRASSFLSSRAKLSPPWYLFNTDATPRQPLLSYRPTRNTCPRGVSLLPRSSRAMEKYSKIIIIFNPFLPPRFAFLVYHFSGYSFHEYERNIMEGNRRGRMCLQRWYTEVWYNIEAESLERSLPRKLSRLRIN